MSSVSDGIDTKARITFSSTCEPLNCNDCSCINDVSLHSTSFETPASVIESTFKFGHSSTADSTSSVRFGPLASKRVKSRSPFIEVPTESGRLNERPVTEGASTICRKFKSFSITILSLRLVTRTSRNPSIASTIGYDSQMLGRCLKVVRLGLFSISKTPAI